MAIIIGVDPGSRITGFGIIESNSLKHKYIASGSIKVSNKDFPERLEQIFTGLSEIIYKYQPQYAAVEQVFMHVNANSALKLGQARGAAITALVNNNISVAEYSARQIKQAVVGFGAAGKNQVQSMVKLILNLDGELQEDAADALGAALCHANTLGKKII